MTRRLAADDGVTLVELIIMMFVLAFVVAGLANVFISGLRASSDSNARLAGQQAVRTAMDRLEYEVRCSSGATVSGGGSTVVLSLPSQCIHAVGSYTWCVSGGALMRYTGTDCSTGSSQTFIRNVTTATPFSLLTATGLLPRLQIALGVNGGGPASDAVSINDTITLRNAVRS
jgi:Tfp pilus assembly protein PilW